MTFLYRRQAVGLSRIYRNDLFAMRCKEPKVKSAPWHALKKSSRLKKIRKLFNLRFYKCDEKYEMVRLTQNVSVKSEITTIIIEYISTCSLE
ncbi:hypothetical protein TNCT_19351 [Trichonephila clavata]|uniref:Uncharacterized protein n=1 Tax=Trichonephila clavata TaxID=2740835 RepID=A0A8X6K7E2_TRICU|nr:hypothetical protein TNCT_19351 [Trichonephila clavata]